MFRVLFTALIAVAACIPVMRADGVAFENLTLPEAQAKAQKEGKMVFVDCYTPWCGPCKYIAQNIFPLDSCGAYMNPRYVCVMKDLEADGNQYIAEKYDVRVYPTFLLLRPDGSLYVKIEGGIAKKPQAGVFIERVESAIKLAEMESRYESGDRNPELIADYVAAVSRQYPQKGRAVLNDYIPSQSASDLVTPVSRKLIGMIQSTDCPAFRHVYDSRAELVSLIGADEVAKMLIDVYDREYKSQRTIITTVFAPRIAQLEVLEKECNANVGFLKERMLIRDVINGNNTSGPEVLAAAIEHIGVSDAPETEKVEALYDLRGLKRSLGGKEPAPVVKIALDKALSSMGERSRKQVESIL